MKPSRRSLQPQNKSRYPLIIAIIIVILIPISALFIYQRNNANSTTTDPYSTASSTPTPTSSATPTSSTPSPTPVTNASQLIDPADVATAHTVLLQTSLGDIKLNLYPDDAPHTVKNFVTLGKRGYYTGVIFHRVIQSFVIQGGDPTGTGRGGESIYGSKFPDEINSHKIVKGSLAMANAGPNTNGSQFYIVTSKDQPSLDGGYTNFGQVADDASQKVVEAIAAVPVDGNDKPKTDVKITGFQIVTP